MQISTTILLKVSQYQRMAVNKMTIGKKNLMTSKERMIAALTCNIPDRVPVAPDFSCMIPCRLTNKPFWDILLYSDPSLWKAYLEAIKYFETDGWFIYGDIHYKQKSSLGHRRKIDNSDKERIVVFEEIETPDGNLDQTIVFPKYDANTSVTKLIKNFKEDFPKFRHLFSEIVDYDKSVLEIQKKELGDLGMLGVNVGTPGLHIFLTYFEGSLEAATYAMYDEPDLFEELCYLYDKLVIKQTEIAIECKVDSILTGGSGSITTQSPDLWRKLSLPTIKKQTKMCKEAGVVCGIHSCGKEKYIVETCASETDLNYINPLELPPMGDCTLSECRKLVGNKLALMGNLHTTKTMLNGTVEEVRLESLNALLDAAINGGFVLSTGDQCGRDTPDENIFEMVKTVEEFGVYPLNTQKIENEIEKLKLGINSKN
jgi:uroporphyrinogen decarboxylase